MNNVSDIEALTKLFEETAPLQPEESQVEYKQKIEPAKKETFWDEEEITPVGFYKDLNDDRKEPKYEMRYKQKVGTADVYLGLSMLDPSVTSCDAVIVTVHLDIERIEDVDLNIQHGYLDLKTPKERLTLKFAYPTKDSEAQAKWNNDEKALAIEVPLIKAEIKLM